MVKKRCHPWRPIRNPLHTPHWLCFCLSFAVSLSCSGNCLETRNPQGKRRVRTSHSPGARVTGKRSHKQARGPNWFRYSLQKRQIRYYLSYLDYPAFPVYLLYCVYLPHLDYILIPKRTTSLITCIMPPHSLAGGTKPCCQRTSVPFFITTTHKGAKIDDGRLSRPFAIWIAMGTRGPPRSWPGRTTMPFASCI